MLERTTEMNLLYDFYGVLLTEKQRNLLELYYLEDWSLGEIAEDQKISRQAVFEAIKRAQATLNDLENKLGLLKKYHERQKIAQVFRNELELYPEAKRAVEPLIHKWLEID
ncbi:putative DNA-binding protein [Thermoflavimicrobium daqui]|jgi:predicted DNA-binding protein YlxM (UPF0122 family)|uniref:UPF0122 protein DL897_04045 n=1 Tax=Thermoflavimicrobium daqui TaxID=2137476 RepID=A0A364K7B1_9BACL|nr:putative DNA-binding protein [Thermoflavimicrobium daqui]RAL26177.1 putative DNA-binding protein [Thermoflavimicrobium daqui]